jgi:hypothetical protein
MSKSESIIDSFFTNINLLITAQDVTCQYGRGKYCVIYIITFGWKLLIVAVLQKTDKVVPVLN